MGALSGNKLVHVKGNYLVALINPIFTFNYHTILYNKVV